MGSIDTVKYLSIAIVSLLLYGNLYSQNILAIPDSVIHNSVINKIDSLPGKKVSLVDSTSRSLNHQLDSATNNLNTKLDSIKQLQLPGYVYAQKLDSAYRHFNVNVVQHLKNHCDSLKMPVNHQLLKMDSIVSDKTHFLDSLLKSNNVKGINSIDIDSKLKTDLPATSSLLSNDLTYINTGSLTDLSSLNIGNNVNLDKTKLPLSIPNSNITELDGVQKSVKGLDNYTGEIQSVSSNADEIKNVKVLESTEKLAEQQLLKKDEFKQLEQEKQAMESMKKQLEPLQNLNANPDSLTTLAKKEFIDHFEGKEEVVRKDMEVISKLQNKYRNVADSRSLPKHPPNEMKGKPVVERLIPGVNLQMIRGNDIYFDVAPFIGYRLSGRIRFGLSVYKRMLYKEDPKLRGQNLFGFRLYGNYKLIKNFWSHLEFQRYTDRINHISKVPASESAHVWKSKINFGLCRTFKVSKRVNGNFLIMYDVLKIKEFPNVINSAVRFGFDYQFRKRQKK